MATYATRNGGSSGARSTSASRLLALAYILAFSMPPLGFGLGIVIALRFRSLRSKHVVWITVISIVAAVIWILIITSGTLNNATTTDY